MNPEFFAYQIIIGLTALLLILRTLVRVFQKKKTIRELILAVVIWGSFAAFALFPEVSNFIARKLGFQLGINALLVISTLFLFYLCLSLYIKSDKIDNSLTKVVRQIALEKLRNTENDQG